jgi:hypothetical protein
MKNGSVLHTAAESVFGIDWPNCMAVVLSIRSQEKVGSVCVVVFLKMVSVISSLEQISCREADGCSGSEEFLGFMETVIYITCSKEPIIGLYGEQRKSGSRPSHCNLT